MIKCYCLDGDSMALWMTLGTGVFMLIGLLIVFMTKNNKKIVDFSISMAFAVMIMLIGAELLPEAYEMMKDSFRSPMHIVMLIGFVVLGILLLKVLDLFIPDHDIEEKDTTVLENLFHIGIVSSIALILHNIIEGMAIYTTVTQEPTIGFLITVGVGLHNIPMGMVVTSTLYQANKSKKKTVLLVLLISISTFFGGLIMYFLSGAITNLVLGILLSITLGMLIYIVVFELLGEMLHNKDHKITILGIITGVVIFLLTLLFE